VNTPVRRQAAEQYKLECFNCHNTVEVVAEVPAHYCPSCGAGPLRIEWKEARAT
jgi:rRNA maturation endonuclease Nob1